MRYIGAEIECIIPRLKDLCRKLEEKRIGYELVNIKNKHTLVKGIKLIKDYSLESSNKRRNNWQNK